MKIVSMEEARALNENKNDFGVEAREWFSKTKNDASFASNFYTNEDAKRIVKELYNAGAKLVIVGEIENEKWRIEEEGDMYSATLFVIVEKDKTAKVKDVIIKYRPDEYSKKKEMLRCWWD